MRTPTVTELEPAASTSFREAAKHLLVDASKEGTLAPVLSGSESRGHGVLGTYVPSPVGAKVTEPGHASTQALTGRAGRRTPVSGASSTSGSGILEAMWNGEAFPRTISLTPDARQALRQDGPGPGYPALGSEPHGQLESANQGSIVPVFRGTPSGILPAGAASSEQGGVLVPAAFGQPSSSSPLGAAAPLPSLTMQPPPIPPPSQPPPAPWQPTSMEVDVNGSGPGNGSQGTSVPCGSAPVLTQINQENSVTYQTLLQQLNVAFAANDPQIIAEAWAAIDAARSQTAAVTAEASHAVGSLQSRLDAAERENQRIREEAAKDAALAERENLSLKQEAHRALSAGQEALRNANAA